MAESIRSGTVSPVESAYLHRLEKINPQLNAIVTIAPDALEKAKEAETAITRGDGLGPLHGVPLTIKDTIETAGLRTTSGSAIRAEFIPERDAPAVARLKAAGAIVLGKTNAAEMAMDYTADNPVFGRTNNPHDLSLTPGGSSGGEAAAIATCMSPAGIGSDLAGSIRIPAHFCGIVGLKPTVGRVPGDGQFPPATGPYSLGAVIGPMARSVNDLRLLFDVLAVMKCPQPGPLRSQPAPLKLIRFFMGGASRGTPTMELLRSVKKLERCCNCGRGVGDAGLIVEERRPPQVERGHELWLKLFSRASVVQLRNVYAGHEDEGRRFCSLATGNRRRHAHADSRRLHQPWMERDRLRAALLDWMETPHDHCARRSYAGLPA